MSCKKRLIVFILIVLGGFTLPAIAHALRKSDESSKGAYFGLNIPYTTVSGDFDGNKYFTEGFTIPEIEANIGFEAVAGFKWISNSGFGYGFELGYQRSSHNTSWAGYEDEANLNSFDISALAFYSAMPLEPYLIMGLMTPWLNVDQSSIEGENIDFHDDFQYRGYGFKVGLGCDFYLSPQLALNVRTLYRMIRFDRIKKGGEIELARALKGDGLGLAGGLVYYLTLD